MKKSINIATYWIILITLIFSPTAYCRTIDGYVKSSTPFLTPHGFEWVTLLYLALFVGINFLFIRQWGVNSRISVISATKIGILIILLGLFTVPLEYRDCIQYAWGGRPFYGLDWNDSSEKFILMNSITLSFVIIMSCCLAYFHPRRTSSGMPTVVIIGLSLTISYTLLAINIIFNIRDNKFLLYALMIFLIATAGVTAARLLKFDIIKIITANIVVYMLCLIPFINTGAYMHGLATWMDCKHRLSWSFGSSLLGYARAHNGKLPKGKNIKEATTELQPYFDWTFNAGDGEKPLKQHLLCEMGAWYVKNPPEVSYAWNDELAGKSILELRKMPQKTHIISCPYHEQFAINIDNFIKAYDDPGEFSIVTTNY